MDCIEHVTPVWVRLEIVRIFKRDASSFAWPDALFGGMILASVVGLIYLFTHR